MANNNVIIEIETAIRRQGWYSIQVGRKSLQTVDVDFDAQKVTHKHTTGTTEVIWWDLDSTRDNFKLIKPIFGPKGILSFSVKGQTASGVKVMPNINYSFSILLSLSPRLVTVTGSHDGYPSYKIEVNYETVYDAVQGWLPELVGDSDVTVKRKSIAWTPLISSNWGLNPATGKPWPDK